MIDINFFSSLYNLTTLLAEQLNERAFVSNYESVIELRRAGKGVIYQISFKNSSLLTFDCALNKEVSITFNKAGQEKIYFIFCLKGAFQYAVNGKPRRLTAFKGATDCASDNKDHTLTIPAGQRVAFCLVETSFRIFDDYIDISKKDLIPSVGKERHFTYYYSLSLQQSINDIVHNKFTGVLRRSYIQGKILEIFSLNFNDLLQYDQNHRMAIDEKDAAYIIEAKEILRKNLKDPPTIKYLAKQVGINENKLKIGFRKLYNTTINGFLTEERLKTARFMLEEKRFIVKEISSEIGYRNPSYFAKLFKKKFGVAPKIYLKFRKS